MHLPTLRTCVAIVLLLPFKRMIVLVSTTFLVATAICSLYHPFSLSFITHFLFNSQAKTVQKFYSFLLHHVKQPNSQELAITVILKYQPYVRT